MIGIDTNVLLRATLSDDPVQSPKAQQFLRALHSAERGLVNIPVLMEFFWVLRSRYKLPRPRLAKIIRDLIEVEHIEFESFETVGIALAAYESGGAEFPDMIVALRNGEIGASYTLTFDRDAAKAIPAMELLA